MIRPLASWIGFGVGLLLVLAAMGFVSLTVVRLDGLSAAAQRRAALEENVRLALWRMDSALAPLIGRENARPAHAYRAFYPARFAYTRTNAQLRSGEVRVPSPLLGERHPYIRLHFELAADGGLSSPQAPAGDLRELAEGGFASRAAIERAGRLLRRLDGLLDRAALRRAAGRELPPLLVAGSRAGAHQAPKGVPAGSPPEQAPRQADLGPQAVQARASKPVQKALSSIEFQARNKAARQVATLANLQNLDAVQQASPRAAAVAPPQTGLMRPAWIGSELLLIRPAEQGGRPVIQGCWLDWPAIRADLLGDTRDLLPRAALRPLTEAGGAQAVRRLASLPVELLPGALGGRPASGLSPIQLSLLLAWLFALLAAGAVAAVLRSTLVLSERRAAFVSAVTHELRTPLTTFRMYTELLAEGLVRDEAKRQDYYRTLQAEADRLDHLVQNVLAYSRLEKTRRGTGRARLAAAELLERTVGPLAERARQQQMELVLEGSESLGGLRVAVDVQAVERILFNLVDNACKYARSAADRRIHLMLERRGTRLGFQVRDHGPGLSAGQARHLFRPFSKSAQAAADSAPGVGLGLALSRRLARRMGGDLGLEPGSGAGACFVLTLPLAD